ncbi:MAG: hypothetical protein O3A46_03465 [Candidatus Poribacteria bacterium]|nr:hypothetical protein [Candidatus Poribacteria bacterium]
MVSSRTVFAIVGVAALMIVSLSIVLTVKVGEVETLDQNYKLLQGELDRARRTHQDEVERLNAEIDDANTRAAALEQTLQNTRIELHGGEIELRRYRALEESRARNRAR